MDIEVYNRYRKDFLVYIKKIIYRKFIMKRPNW